MGAWESPIIIVSTGLLNTVNDTVVGGTASGASGSAKFGGQLGKSLYVSDEQIAQMYSSTVGTLYAGVYQYVQFKAADTVPVLGQAAFWASGTTAQSYTVSTASNGGATNTPRPAGVFISVPTAGNYCFIQTWGIVTVKYKNGLTVAAATGLPVIANSDGTFDTNAGTNVPQFVGTAWTLPVSNSTALVQLQILGGRG